MRTRKIRTEAHGGTDSQTVVFLSKMATNVTAKEKHRRVKDIKQRP